MPNRQVPEGYVGVRDFEEFKKVFETALVNGEIIEALDFDNDLGEGKLEGWQIAKWITDNHPEIFETVKVLRAHSENRGGGRDKIDNYFDLGKKHWKELLEAKERPYPWGEIQNH